MASNMAGAVRGPATRLKFAANLSMMFRSEKPDNLLDRYELARLAGFKAVECAFLYDHPLDEVVRVKQTSRLQQILINSFPGDLGAGELGLAALPNRQEEFRETFERSIDYCKALGCTKIHIMAGKVAPLVSDKLAASRVYVKNLKFAVKRLAEEGLVGLIEPINRISIPDYFLNDFDEAIGYIKEINSPSLKLQLDIFHMQHTNGNLTNKIKECFPYVGHIQIAQVPFRNEPDTPGELDYDYIFKLLQDLGYDDWIGCEYIPRGKTADGLKWINKYGFDL